MKWFLVMIMISAVILSGCEEQQDSTLFMVQGSGGIGAQGPAGNAGVNGSNAFNITYNLTTNITYASVACSDANSYIYNVTIRQNNLTALCDPDSSGGGISAGSCPAGYAVQNTTAGGVECIPVVTGASGGNNTMIYSFQCDGTCDRLIISGGFE